MGAVYRAVEESTGRDAAVKVLRNALSVDEEYVVRFKREAKALSAVEHPGIARFYGTGVDGDVLYFAMELVEGEPLDRRLEDGPLPLAEAFSIAAQIAEALDAAHRALIIHRDVKPSNIIISAEGAKLTDFGLARRADGSGITTSGRIMGSLSYMSPEQVRGERLSAASDVYSLGAVLFEAVTGAPPFSADEDAALATRILSEPPGLASRARALVPVGLDMLLVKMLAKDADLRPTAAEAAGRLRSLAEGTAAAVTFVGSDREAALAEAAAADAAALRREIRAAKKEIRRAEKKREERLAKATRFAAQTQHAPPDDAQVLKRAAGRLRDEAAVFDARIRALSGQAAAKSERLRRLEEKAASAQGGRGFFRRAWRRLRDLLR